MCSCASLKQVPDLFRAEVASKCPVTTEILWRNGKMSTLLTLRNNLSSSEERLLLLASQCRCHEKTEPHGCVEHRM